MLIEWNKNYSAWFNLLAFCLRILDKTSCAKWWINIETMYQSTDRQIYWGFHLWHNSSIYLFPPCTKKVKSASGIPCQRNVLSNWMYSNVKKRKSVLDCQNFAKLFCKSLIQHEMRITHTLLVYWKTEKCLLRLLLHFTETIKIYKS